MPGRLIKQFRIERNITQSEMAELLFMSQPNYSKIENNKVELTAELSKRIVKILKVTLEDILPDDAILESSALLRDKRDTDEIMMRVEQMIDNKIVDLKRWIEERFDGNVTLRV